MIRTFRFYLTGIVIVASLVLWCGYSAVSCYADTEEHDIAESFGLCSKGIRYYHNGDLYEARKVLEEALRFDPRNEEAQGYLDLVNGEIKMRSQGKLDVYQRASELKRESDYYEDDVDYVYKEPVVEEVVEPEEDVYEYVEYEAEPETYDDYAYEEPEVEEEYYEYAEAKEAPQPLIYGYDETEEEPQGRLCTNDKIKNLSYRINENISPAEIKGEYKMALGVTTDDLIWKKANGDYNERNFRMVDHNFPKMNTFDTRVYDRFKVVVDTNKEGKGLNLHSDITVDPWSFVGKTEKFTVADGDDRVEMELKYWSGTRSVINESLYTLDKGFLVGTGEYKVVDGKVLPFIVNSKIASEDPPNTFTVSEKDVDFSFQPVRELWFDYNKDNSNLRIFPFGLEDQALSSDDPLQLSNRHIYWEPSPWLDDWIPGQFNSDDETNAFFRGRWSDDLSFFTRDSDLRRLTSLRGISFEGEYDNTNLSFTVASPKGLWQDYEDVTAIPGAIRAKTQLSDDLTVGLIDTFRIGHHDDNTDSYNHVFGVDAEYDINSDTNIVAEVAVSKSEDDRSGSYKLAKNGSASHIALKKETPIGYARFAFTHMDEAFDSGLSNYKETRRDQFWGRHIHFGEPLEGSTTLTYDDVEPFRIGDGIDSGRNVFNVRFDTKDIFHKKMDNLVDFRHVTDSEHKYVEGVFREENTYRINPEWTSKLLFIYHDLPKTKGGIDPIMYDADTGEYLENEAIEDGKDPSLSTYSIGAEYSPEDWISFFGIYENTNDFTFATGDYPRGLLKETSFTTETIEGREYRKRFLYLYSQGFFELPPYDRFNIYRIGTSIKPSKKLGIDLDFAKNDFKFASGIDNNMNHFGATFKYDFNPKLTGFLKYTFSKAYNLYRLNTDGNLNYRRHHNVFMEVDYNVTEFGLLTIQFGEGSVVSPVWGAASSPFGDSYPTLDTQHILRIYYHGVF